jgi:hypothetical protein
VQAKLEHKIEYVMIDKSATEMCALGRLSITFFLCYFHVLQAWERFVRSAESGVPAKEQRKKVLPVTYIVRALMACIVLAVEHAQSCSCVEPGKTVKRCYHKEEVL